MQYNFSQFLPDLKKVTPGTKVLVRADLNISTSGDDISQDLRLLGTVPLIRALINQGAHVTLATHLGRPKVGYDDLYSNRQLINSLETIYKAKVVFNNQWPFGKKLDVTGSVVLTENVRFLQGEMENESGIAKQMAQGYDIFILESFATSHRKHASNYGIINYCPSYLGPLFVKELENISSIREFSSPRVAIVGGGKSDSKLKFVSKLVDSFEAVLLGGQMASLFMESRGLYAGENNFSQELIAHAREIFDLSQKSGKAKIILPKDLWIIDKAGDLSLRTTPLSQAIGNVVDIGPMTTSYYSEIIKDASSVLQNGPMGIIENKRCFEGTRAILQAIADSPAESILGGGDTNSAIMRAGLEVSNFNFVSTGGGALLHYVAENTLPVMKKLEGCVCSS